MRGLRYQTWVYLGKAAAVAAGGVDHGLIAERLARPIARCYERTLDLQCPSTNDVAFSRHDEKVG